MTTPPDFKPKHACQAPRGFALRDAFEVGDERHNVATLVSGGEIAPTPVEAVDFERSEPAINAARIERDNLGADALASRQDARKHGREGRQRRLIDRGEVERLSPERPPQARQRRDCVRKRHGEAEPPCEIDRGEIGFRFSAGDAMRSLFANDFRPVSCAPTRGRASHLGRSHFDAPASKASKASTGIRRAPPSFTLASLPHFIHS